MQTNKLIDSDSLDKTKCYVDKYGKTYLGKFKETKSIVRYGRQAHSNIFKYGNSMDDKFIEIPCTSNTPPSTSMYNRSRTQMIRYGGGRHRKHNSITKNRRRKTHKSKKNNRRN